VEEGGAPYRVLLPFSQWLSPVVRMEAPSGVSPRRSANKESDCNGRTYDPAGLAARSYPPHPRNRSNKFPWGHLETPPIAFHNTLSSSSSKASEFLGRELNNATQANPL